MFSEHAVITLYLPILLYNISNKCQGKRLIAVNFSAIRNFTVASHVLDRLLNVHAPSLKTALKVTVHHSKAVQGTFLFKERASLGLSLTHRGFIV
jgi:hypothetical protein